MSIKNQRYRANLYEQALLLADIHSRKSNANDRWAVVIDTLLCICDEFANSTNIEQKAWISLISMPPKSYKSN